MDFTVKPTGTIERAISGMTCACCVNGVEKFLLLPAGYACVPDSSLHEARSVPRIVPSSPRAGAGIAWMAQQRRGSCQVGKIRR
jgi:hypothetical protein